MGMCCLHELTYGGCVSVCCLSELGLCVYVCVVPDVLCLCVPVCPACVDCLRLCISPGHVSQLRAGAAVPAECRCLFSVLVSV